MGTRKWNRVYIAAASSDIERVMRVKAQLVAGGMVVTSRWIDEVRQTGANPSDNLERKRRALSDLTDVSNSDVLLFLVPQREHTTRGAWWEGGSAYSLNIPIVSSGSRETLIKSVFTALGEEFENDVDAIIYLLRIEPDEPEYSDMYCIKPAPKEE